MISDRDEGPLRIGEKFLGKYQILGVMGRGGHGCVYHAVNVFMGRHCALKVLDRAGGQTEEMRLRGQTEAALLGRLEHANIVQVYDAGISESGHLYIVMELLKGATLAQYLKTRGPFGVLEGLELLLGMCGALEAAHSQNAVHRDLKPANIFITDSKVPKILDFGIAKIVGGGGFQTQANMVVGTCLYMSPEQIQGQLATARSDLYALGLVMFEAFSGFHPILLDEPDLNPRDRTEVSILQVKKIPRRLDEVVPGFPEYVARLIHTALVKRPGQRFESAKQLGEMALDLKRRYLSEAGRRPLEVGEPSGSELSRGQPSAPSGGLARAPMGASEASPSAASFSPEATPHLAGVGPLVQPRSGSASQSTSAKSRGERHSEPPAEPQTVRFEAQRTAVIFPGAVLSDEVVTQGIVPKEPRLDASLSEARRPPSNPVLVRGSRSSDRPPASPSPIFERSPEATEAIESTEAVDLGEAEAHRGGVTRGSQPKLAGGGRPSESDVSTPNPASFTLKTSPRKGRGGAFLGLAVGAGISAGVVFGVTSWWSARDEQLASPPPAGAPAEPSLPSAHAAVEASGTMAAPSPEPTKAPSPENVAKAVEVAPARVGGPSDEAESSPSRGDTDVEPEPRQTQAPPPPTQRQAPTAGSSPRVPAKAKTSKTGAAPGATGSGTGSLPKLPGAGL